MPDWANIKFAIHYTHMSAMRQILGLPTADVDYIRHEIGMARYTGHPMGISDFAINMNGGPGMYIMSLLMHIKRFGKIQGQEFSDFIWFANSILEEMQSAR